MPRTTSKSPTPRFGLIGFPAAHSLSPGLFRELCGGQWEYDIIETPSFDEAWRIFMEGPYKAVNVTAPFKEPAFEKADIKSSECRRIKAANILIKTPSGVSAYNSDYLAVMELLSSNYYHLYSKTSLSGLSIAVIGFGGAGKAAMAAAEDFVAGHFSPLSSNPVRLFHHDEISEGVKADIIIYTLPKAVPGIDKLQCSILIEANYKNPCLADGPFTYIPGTEWLRLQAALGYPLLVGHPQNG